MPMSTLLSFIYLPMYFLKRFYLSLFLGRRERTEKERDRNINVSEIQRVVASRRPQTGTRPATQACALTGNRTSSLSVHRLALSPLSHTI